MGAHVVRGRIQHLTDGSFIRSGSRSAVNERAAGDSQDEWHNEDQSGLLIYQLLTIMGAAALANGKLDL